MNPVLIAGAAAALIFGGSSIGSFQRDAERHLSEALSGPHKRVTLQVRLGLETLSGVVPAAWIAASDFSVNGAPFHADPKAGHGGKIRRLEFRLSHFQLRGLLVDSLSATIRDVRFDVGAALSRHRIVVSNGGSGPCEVRVAEPILTAFALRKLPKLKDAQASLTGDHVSAKGTMLWQGRMVPFQAEGTVRIVDGIRLVAVDSSITLDGKPLPAATAQLLLAGLNPLLDVNKDLGLDNSLKMTSLALENGFLLIKGVATIPLASPRPVLAP